ncbi:hypothetical protein EDB89DRAFT_2143801 [Lactarius sanguifluus]|nr:hypothetical protein EDB89DRAFT_2143801 [Lactarius sanguifluus]
MTTSMTSPSAFTAIKSLDKPIEKVGPGSTGEQEDFKEKLASLRVSLAERRSPKLYGVTRDDLDRLNVIPDNTPLLYLKPNHKDRTITTRCLGEDKLWSSSTFHQHLELLKGLVTYQNEANPRMWIDAFLFRVSAMAQSKKCTVLDLEQTVVQPLAPVAFSGSADHVESKYRARIFLSFPTLENLRTMTPSVFFITEVKVILLTPGEHISQAIGEMYLCLERMVQDTLRGALTNGLEWIFLVITRNLDSNGARYKRSVPVMFDPPQIGNIWSNLVAGILLHWVENSFTVTENDDWFEVPQYM